MVLKDVLDVQEELDQVQLVEQLQQLVDTEFIHLQQLETLLLQQMALEQ
jgi:hypothetical protein